MENPSRVSVRGSPLYPHSLGTLLGTEWVLNNHVLMESSPLRLTRIANSLGNFLALFHLCSYVESQLITEHYHAEEVSNIEYFGAGGSLYLTFFVRCQDRWVTNVP